MGAGETVPWLTALDAFLEDKQVQSLESTVTHICLLIQPQGI